MVKGHCNVNRQGEHNNAATHSILSITNKCERHHSDNDDSSATNCHLLQEMYEFSRRWLQEHRENCAEIGANSCYSASK